MLYNFQCGFRKGFNAQQCLIRMIVKAKRIMDKGRHFIALLTDLLKTYDCQSLDLLLAKVVAYGFKNDALYLIFDYLNNRKQRVKINLSFSLFQNIISGFHKVLCWVLCYLTFFSQTFFFFVLLKMKAMLMTTHNTQREIVLKKLCKK